MQQFEAMTIQFFLMSALQDYDYDFADEVIIEFAVEQDAHDGFDDWDDDDA